MSKASLVNRPPALTGGCTLNFASTPAALEFFQHLALAVGGVAVDRQPRLVRRLLGIRRRPGSRRRARAPAACAPSAGDGPASRGQHGRPAGPAAASASPLLPARHPGRGDDLAVRVGGQVSLVAVESAGGGLVPVPGLGVHRGDHPVPGHLPGDPEHPVGAQCPGPGRPRWPAAPPPGPPRQAAHTRPGAPAARARPWPASRPVLPARPDRPSR